MRFHHFACSLVLAMALQASAMGADPLDFWQRRESGVGLSLFGVTYGAGRFVAVGQSGVVLTSADGQQWSITASNLAQNLRSIAYGAGTFVTVGDTGALLTSDNGSDWTLRDSTTTNALQCVRWLGDRFMAGGALGTLLSSPDGVTWTQHDSGSLLTIMGVARRENTFVAVAIGNTHVNNISISQGGINWSNQVYSFGALLDVAADASRFVALGIRVSVHSSTNGQDWNSIFDTQTGLSNFGLAHTHGRFIAVGGDFNSSLKIASSPDGAAWKSHPIVTGDSSALRAVAYGGLTIVAVGSKGVIVQSAPFLQLTARSGTTTALPSLELTTDVGITARVQSASTPIGPVWSDITNLVTTSETTIITDPDATAAPARFYRAISP